MYYSKPVEHYNLRKKEIDTLVIHTSPSKCADDIIAVFNHREVSAHYVMDLEGHITQCVPDEYRAWHAGLSYWRDYGSSKQDNDINSRSLGIEICSTNMGQVPYNDAQIKSLIGFCKEKTLEYNISPYNVVGHSDIAATRKADPGKEFPWKKLADNGIGFWYSLSEAKKLPGMSTEKALSMIGYDTRSPEASIASAYAFMRRFIPHRVEVPDNMLDVISKVYPERNISLLNDKVVNVVARAVAQEVLNIRRREKTASFSYAAEKQFSPVITFASRNNGITLSPAFADKKTASM